MGERLSGERRGMRGWPRWALYLTAVVPNLLWAGAYVTGKLAIGTPESPGLGPFRAAFLRFLIAGTIMALWGLWRAPQALRIDPRDRRLFFAVALLGIGLTYVFNYAGLARATGTAAALIMATEPVFIALLAVLLLKERLTPARSVGVTLGLAGAALVVLSTQRPEAAGTPAAGAAMLGNVLMTASLLFESGAVLTVKRLAARYPGWVIVTYEFTIGAVLLLPAAVWEGITAGPSQPAPAAWASFAYLVGPCTVFSYVVWFTLMEVVDAAELSVFIFLQPVVGTLLGVFLLHDPFTAVTALGAALVLAGVATITRSGARTARRDSDPLPEEILRASGE